MTSPPPDPGVSLPPPPPLRVLSSAVLELQLQGSLTSVSPSPSSSPCSSSPMSDTVGQQPPPTRGAPTQIVHLDAESRALPSCPPGYTRFVLISDSHAHTFKVPDGDILLHAGDLTVSE